MQCKTLDYTWFSLSFGKISHILMKKKNYQKKSPIERRKIYHVLISLYKKLD